MKCGRCGVGETHNAMFFCNDCGDAVGSIYRHVQREDGTWEQIRVVRHPDGTWEPYVPTPEDKRRAAETAAFAEWMFGSDKD